MQYVDLGTAHHTPQHPPRQPTPHNHSPPGLQHAATPAQAALLEQLRRRHRPSTCSGGSRCCLALRGGVRSSLRGAFTTKRSLELARGLVPRGGQVADDGGGLGLGAAQRVLQAVHLVLEVVDACLLARQCLPVLRRHLLDARLVRDLELGQLAGAAAAHVRQPGVLVPKLRLLLLDLCPQRRCPC